MEFPGIIKLCCWSFCEGCGKFYEGVSNNARHKETCILLRTAIKNNLPPKKPKPNWMCTCQKDEEIPVESIKQLRDYLNENYISQIGIIEKQELVELARSVAIDQWSIKQLRDYLNENNVSQIGIIEKQELVELACSVAMSREEATTLNQLQILSTLTTGELKDLLRDNKVDFNGVIERDELVALAYSLGLHVLPPLLSTITGTKRARLDDEPSISPTSNKKTSLNYSKESSNTNSSTKTESPPISMKTESPPVLKKTERPPVSKKTESPPVSKKTESPPVLKKTESPPVSKKTESPPISKKTESPPVSKKTESPPVLKKTESPPISKKTESPPVSKKTESPVSPIPSVPQSNHAPSPCTSIPGFSAKPPASAQIICIKCHKLIDNSYYHLKDGNICCKSCFSLLKHCSICQYSYNKVHQYKDQRIVCDQCKSTAVLDYNQQLLPICNSVAIFLRDNLGMTIPSYVEVKMVWKDEMSSVKDKLCTSILGLTMQSTERSGVPHPVTGELCNIKEKRSVTVYILCGLPAEQTAAVVAHEFCHVWVHYNKDADVVLDSFVEEGLAELVAYLWLEWREKQISENKVNGDKAGVQKAMDDILNNPDPIYGSGARSALLTYRTIGSISGVLSYVGIHRDFVLRL